MKPIDRIIFWSLEGNCVGGHLEIEREAAEAGLERRLQLEYMVKALEARMRALERSTEKEHIDEFYELDELQGKLKQEIAEIR